MENNNIFKLPDTGQTSCYDRYGEQNEIFNSKDELYGQNGCFVINPMSFAKLGLNGEKIELHKEWQEGYRTVLDQNTGLIWEVKSPNFGDTNYFDDKYSWKDAKDIYIEKLNQIAYGGFEDWRLPNKDELRTIVDYSLVNPSINRFYFPNCKIDSYWSSSIYEMQADFSWVIFFGFGSGISMANNSLRYVRAVRGGYNQDFGRVGTNRFSDNGDGTITDKVTGLMWQKDENIRSDWFEALNHCKEMNLAGFDDWRLPNIKELNTILNLAYQNGWWYYKDFFPAEGLAPPLLHYFSSTTFQNTFVWVTNFCFGYDGYYANKNSKLLFRAVRNITPTENKQRIFKLSATGQNILYDSCGNTLDSLKKEDAFWGQDGTYSDLNPMSFTILPSDKNKMLSRLVKEDEKGIVKDSNTGLVWELKSQYSEDINYLHNRYTWNGAQEYISKLNNKNYCGYNDWRLPNREELRTIVDYNDLIPAINSNVFKGCLAEFYWSGDENMKETNMAWGIYFAYGCSICYLKSLRFPVRAVRGGYKKSFGSMWKYKFMDNNNGTVSDLNTGLLWKKDEVKDLSFVEALKYCKELSLGGYNDWRLPNIKELATLVDLSYKDGTWFHEEMFPATKTAPQGFYLSSTTFSATFGWGINFQFGYDGYYADKIAGKYPFRPVRNEL